MPIAVFIARSATLPKRHPQDTRRFARMQTAIGMSPLLVQAPFVEFSQIVSQWLFLRRILAAVGEGDVGIRKRSAQFAQRGGGDFVAVHE